MKAISSKKGISPVVATMLLIAFAAALGIIAMNWKPKPVCDSSVKIRVMQLQEEKLICKNSQSIEFTAENLADKDITGLKVRLLFSNGHIENINTTKGLGRGEASKFFIAYSYTGNYSVEKADIVPFVRAEHGDTALCINALVTEQDISECTE